MQYDRFTKPQSWMPTKWRRLLADGPQAAAKVLWDTLGPGAAGIQKHLEAATRLYVLARVSAPASGGIQLHLEFGQRHLEFWVDPQSGLASTGLPHAPSAFESLHEELGSLKFDQERGQLLDVPQSMVAREQLPDEALDLIPFYSDWNGGYHCWDEYETYYSFYPGEDLQRLRGSSFGAWLNYVWGD